MSLPNSVYNVIYDANLGLLYSFETGAVSVPVVPTATTVSAGTGLTGGGALTGNISLALSTAAQKAIFTIVAADPGSPTEGQVWYNSTSHAWKGQTNSGTVTFTVA